MPIDFPRRDFVKMAGLLGGSTLLGPLAWTTLDTPNQPSATSQGPQPATPPALDLAPAKWLWYPGDRTLPNTFVLFRRVLSLTQKPRSARGWIFGDSRYLLEVNGRRIQWGPAPFDPRWPEVDPVDLTEALAAGENAIGATVLFYGHGDGTWPLGRPGFIFRMEMELADGRRALVVSDGTWRCHLSRAWQPGHHAQWFMRALQEEFDARLHPQGWTRAGFVENADWLEPAVRPVPAHRPVLCDSSSDIMTGIRTKDEDAEKMKMELRPRSIAMMRETWVPAARLAEQHRIRWLRPIAEYFAVRPPNAYEAQPSDAARPIGEGVWRVDLDPERGTSLTFELPEQVVGWPGVTIEAPAGTTLELMTQEGHAVGGPALLNTSFHKWARFTCREGVNRFQVFDFHCLRWIQVHFHPGRGSVTVSRVGILKRTYPWPHEPRIVTSEAPLQKLFDAAANTLRNCAQETLVDGMGRERQQYSADCAYPHYALHLLCGEHRQVARFLKTYSQSITADGYFYSAWPAAHEIRRVTQRHLQQTRWGPMLDCGVQFVFDCWNHYWHAGELEPLREPYPRLLRFAQFLRNLMGADDLLPVEDIGVLSVFIDMDWCYPKQRHRQCPFNLKAAEMFVRVLPAMCRALGDERLAAECAGIGRRILKATVARFWSPEHGAFVDNLPWAGEEGGVRYSDITLGMAVMFDQCPGGAVERSIALLAARPKEMGIGYPTNVCWRLWALAKGGRPEAILKEFREIWAPMDSVRLNNTIWEFYKETPDSKSQWSHAAVGPLYITAMSLAGVRAMAPGFTCYEIRPQLADLPDLALDVQTPRGPIGFAAKGGPSERELRLTLPPGAAGELLVHPDERLSLDALGPGRFRLPAGQAVMIHLKHT